MCTSKENTSSTKIGGESTSGILKELLASEATLDELRRLSKKAGKLPHVLNVDSCVDSMQAGVEYAVRDACAARGMKYTELSKITGIDRTRLRNILNGRTGITLREIASLAIALDLKVRISIEPKG